MRRSCCALVAALAVLASGHDARAAKGQLAMTATPVFGADATQSNGWTGVVARLESTGGPVKGVVELTVKGSGYRGDDVIATTRAPFAVPAGRAVLVRLPVKSPALGAPLVAVKATDEGESETYATATLTMPTQAGPVLVDVATPSRLVAALRGQAIAPEWAPFEGYGTAAPTTFAVGAPTFDPATGDPVLPERAAEWAGATVVLVRSDVYARLAPGPRDALDRWVRAGGTLAVVPTRPEDLRAGPLAALLGGEAREAQPGPGLLFAPTPGPTEPEPHEDADEDDKAPAAVPLRWVPTATAPLKPRRVGPPAALRGGLRGYTGGAVAPSAFGGSAPVGLGEVHLLAFDPSERPAVDDPWARGRVAAVVERAWDRRARSAFPLGFRAARPGEDAELRRALDPNESFRPALAIASLLLLVYAVLVGPVLFLIAARRGKPLAPLKWAPAASAVTFGLIVLVGFAGRGLRGRARHLALIEASSGDGRAAVRRFRGFFASRTESLVVPATDASGVVDLASDPGQGARKATLRVERDGMTLAGMTSLAWQTVIVREDALVELGRGVTVEETQGDDATVVNRSGRPLRDVLVWVPKSGLYYAPALGDGATLRAKEGRYLRSGSMLTTNTAGSLKVRRLGTSYLGSDLGGDLGARVSQEWRAVESAAGDTVDWFPEDTPVVLAVLDGPDGPPRDAGLGVDFSRTHLRVVGAGAAQ